MEVVSVNVGLPRTVMWKGKMVSTGIFKEPVEGRVWVRTLNLDGDEQADLKVHGGQNKAVYAYPVEHYNYWRNELPDMELSWGIFGENLTVVGLLEEEVNVGDRLRIGTVELMVTQPRQPCYKLGIRFGRTDMVKRFQDSGLSGFYFSVVREGELGVADRIERISRDENQVTIADINRLSQRDTVDLELLRRAVRVQTLPESWRNYFQQQIEKVES